MIGLLIFAGIALLALLFVRELFRLALATLALAWSILAFVFHLVLLPFGLARHRVTVPEPHAADVDDAYLRGIAAEQARHR